MIGSVTKEREKWIDALKAGACIVVFFNHFYLAFCSNIDGLNKLLSIKPLKIMVNGNYAVCLFLMISAYIICVSIYKEKSFEQIQKMAFKRYFRLMLPVLFATTLSFMIGRTLGYCNAEVASFLNNKWLGGFFPEEQMTISRLVKSAFIEVLWRGDNVFNGSFWMLYILFFGNYLTIILAMITSTDNKRGIFVLMFMLIVYADTYYYCLVLGAVLAYVKCKTTLIEKGTNSKLFTFICLVCLLLAFYIPAFEDEITSRFSWYEFLPAFSKNIVFYNGIGSFLLLFSIMNLNRIKDFLGKSKLINKISNMSFSIYLVHWPIIASFSCWSYLHFWKDSFEVEKFVFTIFLATTLAVVVVAKIFYEVVEKRICTKLTNKICDIYFKS